MKGEIINMSIPPTILEIPEIYLLSIHNQCTLITTVSNIINIIKYEY